MDDHDQAGWTTGAKPRGRDLGLPFPGTPGPHNAITDVAGVEVGYATLVAGADFVVRHGPSIGSSSASPRP